MILARESFCSIQTEFCTDLLILLINLTPMTQSSVVKKNPDLYLFLPMLYTVWSDAVLTPSELIALRNAIEDQQWLTAEEKGFLLSKIDPSSPPNPSEVKEWLQEIRSLSLNPHESASLAEIGVKLVKHKTSNGISKSLEAASLSLRELEKALGGIGRESSYIFVQDSRQTTTASQSTETNFDIQAMTKLLDGKNEAIIKRVKKVIADPEFKRIETGDLAEYREKVLAWCKHLAAQGFGSMAYPKQYGGQDDMIGYFAVMETLSYHDLSLVVKFGVQFGLFGMSIYFLGTEKHHKKYLADIGKLTLPGCFAMTETGHGSNVKGILTTATYNHADKTFTIHTPTEIARKEYIGNAALHGQMATVFAKLIVDGKDFGVSAFVVRIREENGKTSEGVTIKDCGRKMGLNGVDNGVIYFDNVVIPKENMLDRFATVDDGGKFASPITSDNRRFFTMLGTLVGGRIGIPRSGLSATKTALTIAIQYGDKRQQFGPEGGSEVPILNYQTHQRRLMPLLANAYAFHFALQYLTDRFMARTEEDMQEIEALAAGLKALATWNASATIQECRECCGGKGYLSENRMDDLKNDTEIYTTFEGDNTVLLQLVAKSKLTEFKQEFSNINVFGMLNYVANQAKTSIQEKNPFIVRNTDEEHLLDPEFQLNAFAYRERAIVTSAAKRLKALIDSGMDSFDAFNECQHHLVQVGFAYIERVVLEQFISKVDKTDNESLWTTLKELCDLYALSQIEKNKGWYLENGYMDGVKTKAIRKLVDRLCANIRKNAVPLTQAFDIPSSCLAPIINPQPTQSR
jgi:acyl-CoA oxidase